jgi:hypothetical protein
MRERGICIYKILISNLALNNSKHELNQTKLWTNITLTACPRKHKDGEKEREGKKEKKGGGDKLNNIGQLICYSSYPKIEIRQQAALNWVTAISYMVCTAGASWLLMLILIFSQGSHNLCNSSSASKVSVPGSFISNKRQRCIVAKSLKCNADFQHQNAWQSSITSMRWI